jgi:DNA-binding MarR family transcriptional regulator
VRLVEQAISPSGAPVVGLQLFMAYGRLARSMAKGTAFATIKPASIGVPSLLQARPGLSQTELADLLGVQRMTAGTQVEECIRRRLVRRSRSSEDRRKYELFVTTRGRNYLKRVARLIPLHEQYLFGGLTQRERASLHRILRKLIDAPWRGRIS